MKKMLLWSLVFFFGLAPIAFAQGFVPLAPIPGLTEGATANTAGLATFFNNLYKYLIGLAAVLAVIQITWAGIEIALHRENVSSITEEKGKIRNAIFGLILVLSPVLVFSIINPSILNLSINLPELKTTTGTSAGTGSASGTGTVVTDPTSGCGVSGTVLQHASCPSTEAAQTFVSKKCAGRGILLPITSVPQESCKIVNGQQVCTSNQTFQAVCEQTLAGTFVVINLGQTLSISTILQPVSDNATAYTNFATSCKQDQGTFCGSRPFSAVGCPSTVNITLKSGQSGKCYPVTSIYCGSSYCSTQGGSILPTQ